MTHRDVDIPLKKDVQIANRPKRIRKPYFLLGQFVFMILFTIKELSILLLINYIYRYCHLFFLNKEALLHDSNNLFYITRYLPERFPQGRCGANPVFNVGFSQRVWSGKNSPYTPHTRSRVAVYVPYEIVPRLSSPPPESRVSGQLSFDKLRITHWCHMSIFEPRNKPRKPNKDFEVSMRHFKDGVV